MHACGPKVRRLLQIRAHAFKFLAPQPVAALMIPWRFAIVSDGLRWPEATMETPKHRDSPVSARSSLRLV